MVLQTTWQGCDSSLAAPLILDLARLVARAHEAGLSGPLSELGFYFKDPVGEGPAALGEQYAQLVGFARRLRGVGDPQGTSGEGPGSSGEWPGLSGERRGLPGERR